MRPVVVLVLVVGLAACGGPKMKSSSAGSMAVKTTGGDLSSLAQYTTYSHETARDAPVGYAPGPLRPEVIDEARRDVDAELTNKGYMPVENGELVVRISSGTRKVEDQPTGAMAAVGAPAMPETEGELVIDIFERASGRQVFHGFARDVLHDGTRVDDKKIAKAVSKILERVPAHVR